jgi:hypothetical protein
VTVDGLEERIAGWRAFVAGSPGLDDHDVDELEAHLRDQIVDLDAAGLSSDEAFLVAVKRMGDLDSLSREYAREHHGRLWKQLVLGERDEAATSSSGWVEALAFAVVAGAVAQLVFRVAAATSTGEPAWLVRNLGLFVLPILAAYFTRRRRLDVRGWLVTAVPFVVAAVVVNLYPYREGSATELLVAVHLPVVLWAALAYPYLGGRVGAPGGRMDVVRFTGEWAIYYVLIALGGGVLMGLTAAILEPIGPMLAQRAIEWVLPSGAAGAVIVAAWLVEAKQRVVENMAPVLTTVFTPLFALMLTVAAVTYVVSGVAGAFDRDQLLVFDALLIVVLGLVLYAMSARDPSRPAGLMDRVQLVAVGSALVLDLMVLGSMLARVGDLGLTPNRAAALGLNVVLLVNLAGTAWLSARFVLGRRPFHDLERWQTSYLPVLALWAAVVVVVLPPLFSFA